MVFEENSCAISGEIESLRFQLDDKVKQLHYWKMKLGVKLTLKPKDMKCLSTQIQELKVWDKGLEKNVSFLACFQYNNENKFIYLCPQTHGKIYVCSKLQIIESYIYVDSVFLPFRK